MKPANKIILSIVVALISTLPLSASDRDVFYEFNVEMEYNGEDIFNVDESPRGHRMPSRVLTCIISYNGIVISGVDEFDMIMFEVYNDESRIVATYQDLDSFLNGINDLNGEIEIRLTTDNYIFKGFLSL